MTTGPVSFLASWRRLWAAMPLVLLVVGVPAQSQARPSSPSTVVHVMLGVYAPPAGGPLQGVTPLAGAQLGRRSGGRFALIVTGMVVQPRCAPGRCSEALLAAADAGAEYQVGRVTSAIPATAFISAGAGARWVELRFPSAQDVRSASPSGFLGAGAELRLGRAGFRTEGRAYAARSVVGSPSRFGREMTATAALSYHFP